MGDTCANRRPALRAAPGLACSSGSASRLSRSAYSASIASIAGAVSVISPPLARRPLKSYRRNGARSARSAAERAPIGELLVVGSFGRPRRCARPGALAVALLEARHTAAAVEDLLLAGVEGMALRADLYGDLSALLGAAGGEAAAAAAQHSGLDIVRVNTRFHGF